MGELERLEGTLEPAESLGIVDAYLELGRVAKKPPSCLSVKPEMAPFSGTRASQKIVQDMKVSLARGHIGDPASLQTMVEQLATH